MHNFTFARHNARYILTLLSKGKQTNYIYRFCSLFRLTKNEVWYFYKNCWTHHCKSKAKGKWLPTYKIILNWHFALTLLHSHIILLLYKELQKHQDTKYVCCTDKILCSQSSPMIYPHRLSSWKLKENKISYGDGVSDDKLINPLKPNFPLRSRNCASK